MIFSTPYKREDIKVRFDNRTEVGNIYYNEMERLWRIQFKPNVKLSYHYLIDIAKFMKRLK